MGWILALLLTLSPLAAADLTFEGYVQEVVDRSDFFESGLGPAGRIRRGDLITGRFVFPRDYDGYRDLKTARSIKRYNLTGQAHMVIELQGFRFQTAPGAPVLVEVVDDYGSRKHDFFLIRSYSNDFITPEGRIFVFEKNHIALQLEDPTHQVLRSYHRIPKLFEMARWRQSVGLMIRAGESNGFVIRAQLTQIERDREKSLGALSRLVYDGQRFLSQFFLFAAQKVHSAMVNQL